MLICESFSIVYNIVYPRIQYHMKNYIFTTSLRFQTPFVYLKDIFQPVKKLWKFLLSRNILWFQIETNFIFFRCTGNNHPTAGQLHRISWSSLEFFDRPGLPPFITHHVFLELRHIEIRNRERRADSCSRCGWVCIWHGSVYICNYQRISPRTSRETR